MPFARQFPRPPAELLAFARGLRAGQLPAETMLWHLLRARRLGGFKFRRQHPVKPYVLDFYCAEKRLGIELDGSQHAQAPERDAGRDAFLAKRGVRVLRFWNDELVDETEAVLGAIWEALTLSPPRSLRERGDPPPGGGG